MMNPVETLLRCTAVTLTLTAAACVPGTVGDEESGEDTAAIIGDTNDYIVDLRSVTPADSRCSLNAGTLRCYNGAAALRINYASGVYTASPPTASIQSSLHYSNNSNGNTTQDYTGPLADTNGGVVSVSTHHSIASTTTAVNVAFYEPGATIIAWSFPVVSLGDLPSPGGTTGSSGGACYTRLAGSDGCTAHCSAPARCNWKPGKVAFCCE